MEKAKIIHMISIGLGGNIQYRRNGDKMQCAVQSIAENLSSVVMITPDPRVCAGEDVFLEMFPPLEGPPIKCAGKITRRSESDSLFEYSRGYLVQMLIEDINRMDRRRLEFLITQQKAFMSAERKLRQPNIITPEPFANGESKTEETNKPNIYNILIVDDEQTNLSALKRTLRVLKRTFDHEYNIFSATNGDDAWSIIERNDISFIIADQLMPGMTGVELLEKTLQKYPDTIRIILTAHTDEKLLIDAINRVHVHGYIIKPWEPEDIIEIVKQGYENQGTDLYPYIQIGG